MGASTLAESQAVAYVTARTNLVGGVPVRDVQLAFGLPSARRSVVPRWRREGDAPSLLVLVLVLCAACAPNPSPTATPQLAASVTSPAVVSIAPTATAVVPTATPVPPTPTPVLSLSTPTAATGFRVGNTGCDGVYLRRPPNLTARIPAWPHRP